MRVHPGIHRQGQRIVGQIAVRVAIEVPDAPRMAPPDAHGVVAKDDALIADMNLRKGAPRGKEGLTLTSRLIVISLDEMDRLARDSIAMSLYVLRASETKISEEIKGISWLHAGIQSFDHGFVHFSRVRKRAIAEADDIEMPEMKICSEPSISHLHNYAKRRQCGACLY